MLQFDDPNTGRVLKPKWKDLFTVYAEESHSTVNAAS